MDNPIHFHILTASYNRPDLVKRCYESLLKQQGSWEWWVGDDASTNIDESFWEQLYADIRVHNIRFTENGGCNRTRNRLLQEILSGNNPGFVIILDDDDYLKEDALLKLTNEIQKHPKGKWFISYGVYPQGKRLGEINTTKTTLNYLKDYMLSRQIRGDFTHCFHTDVIGNTRFTERFKNSEEWYFFVGLSQYSDMILLDIDTKVLEYLPEGLTQKGFNREQKLDVQTLKVERLTHFLTQSELAPYQLKLAKLQLQAKKVEEAQKTLANTQPGQLKDIFKLYWLNIKANL